MRTCPFLLFGFLFAMPGAYAGERLPDSNLRASPATREPSRKLASIPSAENTSSKNEALFQRLKPGSTVILQNSLPGWEDQIAEITEKYDDGSVRLRLRNGKLGAVKAALLADSLSPEVESGCGESHGVRVCKGDKVYYPARSSSLDVPEAPVSHIFENGTLSVRDGAEFVMDWKQVGKPVACSPKKESICVGDHVHADGYKNEQPLSFEGKVEKAYSNGVVIVHTGSSWRFPIDASALKKRIGVIGPSRSIASEKKIPQRLPASVKVSPEIEPLNVQQADEVDRAR